jgi:hypothetical protein
MMSATYGVGKAGKVNIGSYGMFVKVDSVTADGEGVDNIIAIIMIQVELGGIILMVSPQALRDILLRPSVLKNRWHSKPRLSHWQRLWLFKTPARWLLLMTLRWMAS